MTWKVASRVTGENPVEQIMNLMPAGDLADGAGFQLIKAKEYACDAIPSACVRGQSYDLTIEGHSQSDNPGSEPDYLNITIRACV